MTDTKESTESKSFFYTILPILLCGLSIPLSLFLWLGNLALTFIRKSTFDSEGEFKVKFRLHWKSFDRFRIILENEPIPPTRWLFSTLVPILLMAYGLKRKGVNYSGAALGIVVAITLSLANHAFLACLATFFFSSSRVTKFRSNMKRKIEADFKGGWLIFFFLLWKENFIFNKLICKFSGEGKRNWVQVLCNGGMAMQLALLYLLDCGSSERPIDFTSQYRSSWLGIAVMSAFACCNGDTWASEIGSVMGTSDPFLITTRKRVPRGTNGGVTFIGLLVR